MAEAFRYSQWDGTQEVFSLSEDALMDELSDQLLANGDVTSALRNILRRGLDSPTGKTKGVQDLLEELRNRKQRTLDTHDLSSVLDDIRKKLEDILQHEKSGIEKELDRARRLQQETQGSEDSGLDQETVQKLLKDLERRASSSQEFLQGISSDDTAGAIKELRDYEFMDAQAKQEFDELLQMLQQQAANSLFKDLSQSLQDMSQDQVQALKQMVRDLNEMLQHKLQGGEPDFQQFMDRYEPLLGPNPPADLDDLIEEMRRRMAQMQSLMDSMSPDQKQELQDLLRSALNDQDLQRELAELAAIMDELDPMSSLRQDYPFSGTEELDLSEVMEVMEQLQRMDALERQLRKVQQGGSIDEVDLSSLEDLLGEEARQALAQLAKMSEFLEDAGYIRKVGNRYELTPRGMRKIGHRALQEIFAYIKKDRIGSHQADATGYGIEYADATKSYEFGDPFIPHMQRTILNAVLRDSAGTPVKIRPEDFEIYRTEQLAQASTVLMLDLSLSMAMRGNFMAAKKVALAMDNLIRTQFPRDKLFIVGFSTYARELKPEQLAHMTWDEFDPYTNIQHGLLLAQKLLSRTKGGTKQIIMISDGEPTAHMEGGQVFLQYPPSPRTIRQTLAEVRRCTQQSIVINTFMLDRNSFLVDFVEQLTRLNRGRVFYTTPERLGHYILVDYLNSRKRKMVV